MIKSLSQSTPRAKAVGAGIVAAAVISIFVIDWRPETPSEEPVIRPLKTVVMGTGDTGPTWRYPAKANAGDSATIAFEVSGTVKQLLVKEGDQVKAGQVLATLDSRDYKNAAKAAQAEKDRAKAQLDRIKIAAKSNAVSDQEVSNAQAGFDKADADLAIRTKAVEDTQLTARFDSTVARTLVKSFENIQAKQPIITLQSLAQIEIIASIPESRLALINPDRKRNGTNKTKASFYATFDYFHGRQFPLTLKEFSTEADPATQTFTATFVMDAPTDVTVLPGMTAMVNEVPPVVQATEPDAPLLAPLDSCPVDGLGQYYVWLLQKESDTIYSVSRKNVAVGEMTGDNILITSGLQVGDRIAAAGAHVLQEGQKVLLLNPGS